MKQYLMALDAGTGSVRAVVFDVEGNQIGVAQREWQHREDCRWPGSMCFDWQQNWALTVGCIREVLQKTNIPPQNIAAISTTCMREGIVLYNKAGQEIWACANVDSRSNDEVAQLIALNPALEKEIYQESGQAYALGALPRLLWVKNKQPEIYNQINRISMLNDWLIYRLTGVLCSEPSNGSTTGLFNLEKRQWQPDIAAACGLRTNVFPPVYECGSLVGRVSGAKAQETGLCEGTPVVAGGGDAQLGCIGVGVLQPGQAAVFGGSFWQYEYNIASAKTDSDARVRVNCHALPDVWQYEALAFKPGLVMRWYRDAFCALETQQAKATGQNVYALMDKKAAEIPAGCYGMLCAFSDVMNFLSWKHAAPTFSNFDFDPQRFNCYTFYRAIMENTALVTLGNMRLVQQATGKMLQELVFAGGAAKSPLWVQILADVTGLCVHVPKVKEATALGAAILAGVGVGIYADICDTARKVVKLEKTYTPNWENHKTYQQLYASWAKFYGAQLELSNQSVTRYMWAAPGLN